jgi:hypothetical protein
MNCTDNQKSARCSTCWTVAANSCSGPWPSAETGTPPPVGSLRNEPSEPQDDFAWRSDWNTIGCRPLFPAARRTDARPSCPIVVASLGLELAAKHRPGRRSVKLRQFRIICAGPYVPTARVPCPVFHCHRLVLELPPYSLQVSLSNINVSLSYFDILWRHSNVSSRQL